MYARIGHIVDASEDHGSGLRAGAGEGASGLVDVRAVVLVAPGPGETRVGSAPVTTTPGGSFAPVSRLASAAPDDGH